MILTMNEICTIIETKVNFNDIVKTAQPYTFHETENASISVQYNDTENKFVYTIKNGDAVASIKARGSIDAPVTADILYELTNVWNIYELTDQQGTACAIETTSETNIEQIETPDHKITINVGKGSIVAYAIKSEDNDYVGIRIEYVDNDDNGSKPGRPAVSLEIDNNGTLEARLYDYKTEDPIEDYTYEA